MHRVVPRPRDGPAAGERAGDVLGEHDLPPLVRQLFDAGHDAHRPLSQRDVQPIRRRHPGAVRRVAAAREQRCETPFGGGVRKGETAALHVVGRLHHGTLADALGEAREAPVERPRQRGGAGHVQDVRGQEHRGQLIRAVAAEHETEPETLEVGTAAGIEHSDDAVQNHR